MKIITMATLKGGAGKTMNAFNIGGILAERKKVLFVDIDPQCNLSADCGIDISDRNSYTIRDVYDNPPSSQPNPEDIIVKSPISELPKLDIIPSSIFLSKTERILYAKSANERILRKYIDKHSDVFNQWRFGILHPCFSRSGEDEANGGEKSDSTSKRIS